MQLVFVWKMYLLKIRVIDRMLQYPGSQKNQYSSMHQAVRTQSTCGLFGTANLLGVHRKFKKGFPDRDKG